MPLLAALIAIAPPKPIEVPAIPKTVEEFRAWRDSVAKTPEGGAAAFAVALYVYSEDQPLGTKFLTLVLDQSMLGGGDAVDGKEPLHMKDFRDRNAAKPYIARSLFQGTSFKDGYKLPALPLKLTFRDTLSIEDDDNLRIYIQTSGAPSPKPLRLRRNDKGIWKALEWSSFQGNCKPPETKKSDEL